MSTNNKNSWETFNSSNIRYTDLGFSIDTSKIIESQEITPQIQEKIKKAFIDINDIESGKIMNPDENRKVGHYWLRNTKIAPDQEAKFITSLNNQIKNLSENIISGNIVSSSQKKFTQILLIGIGGSALGPQLIEKALVKPTNPIKLHFFDNTDPIGINGKIEYLYDKFEETLVIVVSKSGGTAETRNGMKEIENAFKIRNIDFSKHAIAITGKDSKLDNYAKSNNWIARLYMPDWVGGRTSITTSVGLLPACLLGIDIDEFLLGACKMDEKTRINDININASMKLALTWYFVSHSNGNKDMVIIPYCDNLSLLSKYLQQLVMESLGKEKNLDGKIVNQGIAVYGNKGSTDQHAYIQQLRDGINNFFVTFIEVKSSKSKKEVIVDEINSTSADYLQGFLRGTRNALFNNKRSSITISIDSLSPFYFGMLIALYERAVSFYASLVNINAYNQPGVESGKKAANDFINLLSKIKNYFNTNDVNNSTADEIALNIKELDVESVYHCLIHLSSSGFINKKEGLVPKEDIFYR